MVHACLNYDSHIYLEIFSANKKSIRLCRIFMVSYTLWKCKCFFTCKETSLETKVFNPFPYGFSTIIFSREMVQPWFFVTFDLIIRRTFFWKFHWISFIFNNCIKLYCFILINPSPPPVLPGKNTLKKPSLIRIKSLTNYFEDPLVLWEWSNFSQLLLYLYYFFII